MLYLVSFFLLDLRFVITRPFEDEPRYEWLKPQWLWARRNVPQVGRLGIGRPIPGRDRMLPAFSQHATVDGGLMLQTQREFDERRVIDGVDIGGFVIRNREVVADEWGQVRFDLLLEGDFDAGRSVFQHLESVLGLSLVAPLDEGTVVVLAEAGELVASIYERQSLKTSGGFLDLRLRDEAVAATAGTVFVAAEAPQVILIDVAREIPAETRLVSVCDAPCHGTLAFPVVAQTPFAARCWHLLVTGDGTSARDTANAAWCAAFGLSWLVGHLHELVVFGSRVDEYEQNGRLVLRDLVRASIRNRNNRFGAPRFGGWKPDEVLKGAAQMLGLDQARQSLQGIKAFAEDHRDAGGITGNIFRIINITNNVDFMEPVTMSTTTNTFSGTFTGSNLNVSSTLSNVSQNIGLLPNADQGTKEALTKLLGELHAELDKLSASKPERKQQVEDVAAATDDLFEKAKQEKPNPTLLQRALDGVKTVAKTLEDIAPSVLSTVTTIVGIVAKLHGL